MALDQLMSRRLRRRQPHALQLSVAAAPADGAGAAAAPQALSAEASAVGFGAGRIQLSQGGVLVSRTSSGYVEAGLPSSQARQHLYSRHQQ
jgi:hypothetical protein